MKKSQLETLIREVIRETIRKVDGKYVVYPEKGGKRLGTHSTKKAAEKQLTAIHLNKEAVEIKYTNPNFDAEWQEAVRYPEFNSMGKESWIRTARVGQPVSYSSIKDVLGNVDLNFEDLEEPKKQRFQAAFEKGIIEMPIAVKFSDDDYDLVAGNTRLSGLVKNGIDPKIWIVDLSKMQENYADGKGKYIYIGTCMNSFDDWGECKHNAFYDEEHFFNSWENADEISKEEFWSNIDPSSDKYQEVKKYEADPEYTPEYRYSPEDDIYYIFINDDTHYFFVNPDTLRENYADGKVKGKSRPGRVKRSGASCKGSVTDLRAKAKKYGGEKGKMYHWCANMKGGKKK